MITNITGAISFDKNRLNAMERSLNGLYSHGRQGDAQTFLLMNGAVSFTSTFGAGNFHFTRGDTHIFLFGTVFANKKYKELKSAGPKELSGENIYALYADFGAGIVDYIKGNFVIVIYDAAASRIVLISSRLNTLPLYYYCDNNEFVFSSSIGNILKFPSVKSQLSEKALLEQVLFYYPLGDKTHFDDIFQIPPASIIEFDASGLSVKNYWRLEKLFLSDDFLSEEAAFEECLRLMRENLDIYTSGCKNFLLSLTGGFDSRTNLSLTKRNYDEFLCYSYGLPGSRQISIPLAIAKKIGLNYQAIYLNDDFSGQYEDLALKVLKFSDGTAPIIRAMYPYVFDKLRLFSGVNVSGMFGSEILKPFWQANQQVSQGTLDLFMSDDFDKTFSALVKEIKENSYVNARVIEKYAQEVRDDFSKQYIKGMSSFGKLKKFYIFMLGEAVRKYFTQEIRVERPYVETRTPYFDEEFLELILKTTFAGIYKGAVKKSIFSRRNSQVFYAKIIAAARPELGGIATDRGYAPGDLLLPPFSKACKIIPLYLRQKIINKRKGNDTFNSHGWARPMIEKYIKDVGGSDDVFTDKLSAEFANGGHLKDNFCFFSMFSLRLWLSLFRKGVL